MARDIPLVSGCTTSRPLMGTEACEVLAFSLAAHTDISAESYRTPKLLVAHEGELEAYANNGRVWPLRAGDALCTPCNEPVGMRTNEGSIYTEVSLGEGGVMNDALKAGEVLRLADLLPYQDGTIVNMDLAHNDKMKFALMSFDAGCSLSEHAAPGEALIFALDGEGVIGYEGVEHVIHAGENFKFAKNGRHFVRADKRFKMALLLTLG